MANGNHIFLVYIPQSDTAHQAHDKRYYKRYNFKSEAMEDYEIRDVMNRIKWPVLEPHFSSRRADRTIVLNIEVKNVGPIKVSDFALRLLIPAEIVEMKGHGFNHLVQSPSQPGYQEIVLRSNTLGSPPIFPRDRLPITEEPQCHLALLVRGGDNILRNKELGWTIYADNAPPRKGEVDLFQLATS